jgi:ATP-dependent DNA helicase MPH1
LRFGNWQLQRIGRAGRKRDGHIHVLATVGREDRNWDAAIFNHREIQSEIIIGANLELYDDAPLLLDRMPEPVLQRMEVDPWVDEVKNRGNKRKSRATAAKAPKRQRGAPVPEGIAGFVKASELTNKGRKTTAKRGKAQQLSSEDDSDLDEDLPDLRDVTRTTNDSSDSEITTPPSKRRVTKKTPNKRTPRESATKRSNRASYKNFSSSSDSEQDAPMEPERDDFFESVFGGPPLSSVTFSPSLDAHDSITNDNNDPQTTPLRPINGSTRHTQVSKTPATGHSTHSEFSQLDDRWMLDLDDDEFQPQMPGAQILAKPFKPPTLRATPAHGAMGPPASVQRSSAHTEQAADAPTSDASPIIIRRRGGNRVAIVASSEPDTPVTAEPVGFSPASLVHRTARPDSSPAAVPARRRTKPANPRNIFVDDDVGVSGDDEDEDEEELSDVESESDRQFAGHFKATQAPKGYNQRRAYLAGLATQAPSDGPVFANRHHRHNDFLSKARRPILLSQEDTRQGPSSDYEGSFVCDDDEPVAYESASDEDMAA